MNPLERLLGSALALIALLLVGWFGVHHYGALQYDSGYQVAVAQGKQERDRQAEINRQSENDLRSMLHAKDTVALQKELDHAQALADAQRRVRAGTDRLRCPASTVQPTTTASDRPAATGPTTDGQGPDIVPDDAAEILGDAANVAGLVRRYERVVERFEECRAVNAK